MIKILIVDDSEFDREKIVRSLTTLKTHRYDFKHLQDGRDIETIAVSWNPDLIILDLNLPGFSGIDILRDLSERWGNVPLPIIMATGNGNEAMAVEAMKLGALDYVVKDGLTGKRLAEVVNRALEKSQLQKKIKAQNEVIILSQKRLKLAMESANMGSWEWDTKSDLIYWDHQTAAIMGISETSEPRTLPEFLANVHKEFLDESFKRSNSTESYKEYSYVFPVTHADNTIHWVKNYGKADDSILENGVAVKFHGTCLDVTDQHLYQELQAARLSTSRTDVLGLHLERELREQFVSTLSHDLRNPLSAALMGTELILRNEQGKPFHTSLKRIKSNLNRVDHMIQDLLDANRIGAGQPVPLNIVECDLDEVIQDTIMNLEHDFGKRFKVMGSEETPGHWDKFSIQRVFENILTNAIKYGIPETDITVKLKQNSETVSVSIHNHSKGLTKADQEKIFKPFHRTSSADNSNVRGWGLGLTIVRGITDAHGGKVSLESAIDEGVTFTVELPRDCRPFVENGSSHQSENAPSVL